MRGTHAGMAVVGVVTLVVACGEGKDEVRSRLVDYAEGDWSCDLAMPEDFGGNVDADVTIEADGADSGEYTVELSFEGEAVPPFTGDWELDGTDLQIEAPDLETRYAVEGVELDTDGVEILEDGPDHEPVDVDIERDGDQVELGWLDPWTDEPVTMDCTKD